MVIKIIFNNNNGFEYHYYFYHYYILANSITRIISQLDIKLVVIKDNIQIIQHILNYLKFSKKYNDSDVN